MVEGRMRARCISAPLCDDLSSTEDSDRYIHGVSVIHTHSEDSLFIHKKQHALNPSSPRHHKGQVHLRQYSPFVSLALPSLSQGGLQQP